MTKGLPAMTITVTAATSTWTTAADLPAAATWSGQHDGALTLADGTVLVLGGADATNAAVNRTAIFDPVAGTWHPAAPMGSPRQGYTATLLTDGRVLVTGGVSGSAPGTPPVATAELYDPAKQQWTATGMLSDPRAGHSAALLPDGTVLVAGGTAVRDGQTTMALRTAERYHPDTGQWSPAAAMTDARTGHTAIALDGGAVLVCGGTVPVGTDDDAALAFCELYDQAADRWAPTGSLHRGRRHHQATRVSGGTVLITGGTAPGAPGGGPFDPFAQRTAELYDLASGTWQAVADMPSGRGLHRAVPLAAGQVLVVGGAASDRDEAGYRSAVRYDVTAATWTPVAGLTTGRWGFAAAVLADGRVLVTGGIARSGLAAADPSGVELTTQTEIFAPGTAS